jgi:hypothetical protein
VVFMNETRFGGVGVDVRGGKRGYRHPISNLGDETRFSVISADRAPRAESLTHTRCATTNRIILFCVGPTSTQ